MQEEIMANALIVGVNNTKSGKSILDYIILDDGDETPYHKGFKVESCWLGNNEFFQKATDKDLMKPLHVGYKFVKDFKGQFTRQITHIYNDNGEVIG